MSSDPRQFFQEKIEQAGLRTAELSRLLDRILAIRLGVFAASAVLLYACSGWGVVPFFGVIMGMISSFILLVKWNNQVKARKRHAEALVSLNEEEIRRLDLDLDGIYGGEEFGDPDHEYASDLDLFGEKSLFQLVNRGMTALGRSRLAAWLLSPSMGEEIRARQQAVAELAGQPAWRQEFQAQGMLFEGTGESPGVLGPWLGSPPEVSAKWYLPALPLLLIPIPFVMFGLALAEVLSIWYAFIALAANMLLIRQVAGSTKAAFEFTQGKSALLRSYSSLLALIEEQQGNAPWLARVKEKLAGTGNPASREIRRFSRIAEMLELRMNGVGHAMVNSLLFWDIFYVIALEKWRQRNKAFVLDWFEVIADYEAASSLAGLRFSQPAWAMPQLTDAELELEGEAVGHPLIHPQKRVENPIHIPRKGYIMLITGSNMSGKSTYLRTVGINAVLALAGAPVCAVSFRLSPVRVITSMRTQDSLSESISSFYAELKRLKFVLEQVKKGDPVVFLLDEILKGTNSKDRHSGARALIRQLHRLGSAGFVSTHDLDLVSLETELPGHLENRSFNSSLREGRELHFDYSLSTGPCKSFNASVLMEQMGIGEAT